MLEAELVWAYYQLTWLLVILWQQIPINKYKSFSKFWSKKVRVEIDILCLTIGMFNVEKKFVDCYSGYSDLV